MKNLNLKLLSLTLIMTMFAMVTISMHGIPITNTSGSHNLGQQPQTSTGGSELIDYGNSADCYTTSIVSAGNSYSWVFSSSNTFVGITVMAMNAGNYTSFKAGLTFTYYTLSNGSYYSDSGTFTTPYSDMWYIVFWNNDSVMESTTLTYSMGTPDVPNAPTSLTATYNSAGYISLSWSAPSSNGGSLITGYNVYRGTSSGNEVKIGTVFSTSCIDYGMIASQTFYYTVTAVNNAGESGQSNECFASVPSTGPIIFNGTTSVSADDYNAYSFTIPTGASNIEISGSFTASGGSGNDIIVMVMNPTDYTNWQNDHTVTPAYSSGQVTTGKPDVSLSNSGTYYLVFDNEFSTISSKTVDADIVMSYVPAPSTPTDLSISPNPSTKGDITLTWQASSGAASYNIYRYSSPITTINSSVTLEGTVTGTTYTDVIGASGTYYYVVIALNSAGGFSSLSSCQSVTVNLSSGSSRGIAGYNFITLFIALAVGGLVILKPLHKKILTSF